MPSAICCDIEPLVRVQTKTGAVVQFAPADVVAVRTLSDAPVRTSQIRALEHAAALAWPGVEQHWLDGWLLRAGHGVTYRANSAVPLDNSAGQAAIPAIVDWYTQPRPDPAAGDRRSPAAAARCGRARQLGCWCATCSTAEPDPSVRLSARPDDAWLRLYRREIPVDVLTAVVDGELVFGTHPDGGGRARPRSPTRPTAPAGWACRRCARPTTGARPRAVRGAAGLGGGSRRDPRLHPGSRRRSRRPPAWPSRWASSCTTARATSRRGSRRVVGHARRHD